MLTTGRCSPSRNRRSRRSRRQRANQFQTYTYLHDSVIISDSFQFEFQFLGSVLMLSISRPSHIHSRGGANGHPSHIRNRGYIPNPTLYFTSVVSIILFIILLHIGQGEALRLECAVLLSNSLHPLIKLLIHPNCTLVAFFSRITLVTYFFVGEEQI